MDAEAPAADPAPGATRAIERRRDAAAAGHAGDAAGARLHLGDDDPMVRSSALRALDRAGGLAASELEAALEDPAPAVRMTALELAAGRGDVPVAATAARLGDDDRRVVEAAAWACGEQVSATDADDGATADVLGDAAGSGTADVVGDADDGATADVSGDAAGSGTADVVAALVEVARSHDDPLCRESAIAALGAIGDPGGLAAILAGLDDKPEVRRRAVIALAPFDGPEVDAALLRATTDRDKQVRAAASELLGA